MPSMILPGSWTERKSEELLKKLDRNGPGYRYVGCCINFDGEFIDFLRRNSSKVTLKEVKTACHGFNDWAQVMGYDESGLRVEEDQYLEFGKCRKLGCYWISHSGIEYVWSYHPSPWGEIGPETGRISCKELNMSQPPRKG